MQQSNISWQKELDDLVATTSTPDEKAAVEAFANAIRPHLDDPTLLRTLLSKIQSTMPNVVSIVTGDQNFPDLDALRNQMPSNVNVVEL